MNQETPVPLPIEPLHDGETHPTATAPQPALSRLLPAAMALAGASAQAGADDLLAKIQSKDDAVRGAAWQGAALAGPEALRPLAGLLDNADFEIARSAKRAMRIIVHRCGRPDGEADRKAAQAELVALLAGQPTSVRREALWLLSEIGDKEAIAPMGALLAEEAVREDARCALLRLPGREVLVVLQQAFASAPEDFKFALADAMRERGKQVPEYPTRRTLPTKSTGVGAKPEPAKSGT